MSGYRTHRATFDQLTTEELYNFLQLRSSIFVVEQKCIYLDLDERDHERSTTHWWLSEDNSEDNQVTAYLRVLVDADGATHVGRVCTARTHRGNGLAGALLRLAIADISTHPPRPIDIHAQSYLRPWYESFGFVVTGDEFLDAGVPHLPMRRDGAIDRQANPTSTGKSA